MASGHGRLPPPFGVPSPPCPFGATIEAAEWCQLRTGEGSSPRTAEMGLRASEKKRAAPSAPRSGPPAATLFGGLRPRSLRVHDPCKEVGHGSRLGFPGRRLPRGPPAPGNVARGLQVLPRQAEFARGGGYLPEGEGSWAWTRRNLVCGRPGSRRRSAAQAGVAVLLPHDSLGAEVQCAARSTHGIVPPGKTHSPSPPGLSYQRGRRCCSNRISNAQNFSANEGCPPERVSLATEGAGRFAGRSPPLVE